MIRSFSLLALALLALLLAACQSGPPQTLEQRLSPYQWSGEEITESLFLLPPEEAGSLIGVSQRLWDNGMEQRLGLASDSYLPGDNYLSLRFFTKATDAADWFTMKRHSLSRTRYSQARIQRRLQEEFPGIRAEIQAAPRNNRYGSYVYATARHGDQSCVFAWQTLEHPTRTLPTYMRALEMEYRRCGGSDVPPEALLYGFENGAVRMDTGVLPLWGGSVPNSGMSSFYNDLGTSYAPVPAPSVEAPQVAPRTAPRVAAPAATPAWRAPAQSAPRVSTSPVSSAPEPSIQQSAPRQGVMPLPRSAAPREPPSPAAASSPSAPSRSVVPTRAAEPRQLYPWAQEQSLPQDRAPATRSGAFPLPQQSSSRAPEPQPRPQATASVSQTDAGAFPLPGSGASGAAPAARTQKAPERSSTSGSAPTSGGGSWSVQVGAYSRETMARDAATSAASALSLPGAHVSVPQVQINGQTLYRARLADLAEPQARQACSSLKGRGGDCMVVRPGA
ncbi:cellulose biosynthesis protein BcsN [Aquibaculum sediminis]|uniref:cellulose biosynthesis protein BcsN n=1 Tax=Aquibaculum sediminis TaxID=3231907 RepID=UPI0034543509